MKNENSLKKMQNKLLEMFKWFHTFCEENDLRYYALGGTMLGAVRHEGFIPWDDDIDVGMPRKDYERFLCLTKNLSFGKYVVESIDTPAMDYFYGYAKIYDRSTTLVEKTRVNIKRGIYIDVFPLDGVGNNRDEIKHVFKPIYKKYQFVVAQTCALAKRRAWYKNVCICFVRLLPNYKKRVKKELLKIDNLCKKKDFDECTIVGNLFGNWGIKEIMPKEYLGTPQLYKFEDTMIYGSEQYDNYLIALYGNWKKLPPVEKRVSIHDCVEFDLNKPYCYEVM